MHREQVRIDPVTNLMARIVEHDDVKRASILIEVEKWNKEGAAWPNNHLEGAEKFSWKVFWVRFARTHNPLFVLLGIPFAVCVYLFLLFHLVVSFFR